jgi:guanylate kinase
MSGRLIILAGPSCVGKSPLDKAMAKFYPDIKKSLSNLVLYNSRKPRPGELDGIDYFFRSWEYIDSLRSNENYVVMEVRGDLQALDLQQLLLSLEKENVFFEGNPFIGYLLLTHEKLQVIPRVSAYMSPVSSEELIFFNQQKADMSPEEIITDIMRRKLLRRIRKQKSEPGLNDLENIEKRASSAYGEMRLAHHFDYVIPNHDGEDSENWEAFYYPIGEARKSLLCFIDIIEGRIPEFAEQWAPDLVE